MTHTWGLSPRERAGLPNTASEQSTCLLFPVVVHGDVCPPPTQSAGLCLSVPCGCNQAMTTGRCVLFQFILS